MGEIEIRIAPGCPEEEDPEYPPRWEIGQVLALTGTVYFPNVVGGTARMEVSGLGFSAKIFRRFWDYETGWKFHGRVDAATAELMIDDGLDVAMDPERRTVYISEFADHTLEV